jgi:hypothetical protein
MQRIKPKRCQVGQSMIEYTVVLMFGVLTLTTGPMKDQVTILMDTIRANYSGYSFAMSLSDIPDSASPNEYWTLLDSQNVPTELKQKLTDRTSNNLQRSPADLQREIDSSGYNGPPASVQNTFNQAVNSLNSISFP